MFTELYRYFILHRSLSLPGIGLLQLNRQPAVYHFADKKILPPAFSTSFQEDAKENPPGFLHWLGSEMNLSTEEAKYRFDQFIHNLKNDISLQARIEWEGIGSFSQDNEGRIHFLSSQIDAGMTAVDAQKIIRQNAEHVLQVGEETRTSTQMQSQLAKKEQRRTGSRLPGLILLLGTIAFLAWHFLQKGTGPEAMSNQQKITPLPSPDTYTILP